MTVLITGANRGIGKALFDGYQARGTHVIGTHRAPPRDGMLQLDVTDPASCAALAKTLGDTAIDTLVCNAGIYQDARENLDTGYSADMWAQTFATNVTGVFLSVQNLLPHLRKAKAAKIAIISSQMGSSARAKGTSLIYRTSKAASLNLGLNLATGLADDGISVGIYHPGWVQTDMGGGTADIDVATSAAGLMDRFDILSLKTTGCFETWDGRPHPI